jgi:hypothetical protein
VSSSSFQDSAALASLDATVWPILAWPCLGAFCLLLFSGRLLHQLHVVACFLGKGMCSPSSSSSISALDTLHHTGICTSTKDSLPSTLRLFLCDGQPHRANCLSLHPSLYLPTIFAGALQLFDCIQGFPLGWTQSEGLLSIGRAYAEPRIGLHRSRLFQIHF